MLMFGWWFGMVWVGGSAYHQPFTDNRIDDVADVFVATNSHYEMWIELSSWIGALPKHSKSSG